jgi:hypothetical protein
MGACGGECKSGRAQAGATPDLLRSIRIAALTPATSFAAQHPAA